MKAPDVKVGLEVQVGADGRWSDEPRRARVVAFERRRPQDTMRSARLEFLRPDGNVDPGPTGSVWWRPADLQLYSEWRVGWIKRQARRDHRRSVIARLAEALQGAGLGDLVSVQAGQAITGTVHMVIGDLVDTEVVTDRLRRLADR